MTRFFRDTLIQSLNSGADALCGVAFKRRLEDLHRDAVTPLVAQVSLFAAGPGRSRLFQ